LNLILILFEALQILLLKKISKTNIKNFLI